MKGDIQKTMRFIDFISISISLIGTALTLYSFYRDTVRAKEVSSFFEYRSVSEKIVIKNLKRDWGVNAIILYACCFLPDIISLFKLTGFLPNAFLECYRAISTLVIAFFVCVAFICSRFIVFIESKRMNSLIENNKVRKTSILEKGEKFFYYYCLVGAVLVVGAYIINRSLLWYFISLTVLVGVCLYSLYSYYLYLYLNFRLQFTVSQINVKMKGIDKPYENIYNYVIQNGQIAVMLKDCEVLKKYTFPEIELEYIEKIIDEENTLLSTKFNDWIIKRKEEK